MSSTVRCADRVDERGRRPKSGRLSGSYEIRFPRPVSPSLAAWRASTKSTQFGILGAAFGALTKRKDVK